MSDSPLLRSLGVVRSSLKDRALAPRQGDEGAPEASIEIDESFLPGLSGVVAGDDLIVITWFHQAKRDTLRVHPRGDLSLPSERRVRHALARSPEPARPAPGHGFGASRVERSSSPRSKPSTALPSWT